MAAAAVAAAALEETAARCCFPSAFPNVFIEQAEQKGGGDGGDGGGSSGGPHTLLPMHGMLAAALRHAYKFISCCVAVCNTGKHKSFTAPKVTLKIKTSLEHMI